MTGASGRWKTAMKSIVATVFSTLLGSVALTASAASVEGARDIHSYQQAAGDSVSRMPATLVDWQALDGQSLTVWTANDKPWLVKVDSSCAGLTSADSVALTSRDGEVAVGTDYVELGSTHCKIASIQPIDYSKVVARHAMMARHMYHKPAMADRTTS